MWVIGIGAYNLFIYYIQAIWRGGGLGGTIYMDIKILLTKWQCNGFCVFVFNLIKRLPKNDFDNIKLHKLNDDLLSNHGMVGALKDESPRV